jgi:hypothetical protein
MQKDMVQLMETADPSKYTAGDLGSTGTVLDHCHPLLLLSSTPYSGVFYSTGKNTEHAMKQKFIFFFYFIVQNSLSNM